MRLSSFLPSSKTPASRRRRKSSKPFRLALRVHVIIAVLSVGIIAVLGLVNRSFSTQQTQADDQVKPQDIGIEHTVPASISVVLARKGPLGYVTFTNASADVVRVSLPTLWHRVEVQGAALADVTGESPALGFVRWTIPAHAGMSLTMNTVPQALHFISTADEKTGILLRTIDLTTDATDRSLILLKHTDSTYKLWQTEATASSQNASANSSAE